jgi:hypothetical protein
MNKKEIATLIIVGVIVAIGAGLGGFFLLHNSDSDSSSNTDDTSKTSDKTEDKTEDKKDDTKTDNTKKTTEDTVKVGRYTLHYGKYATPERDEKGNRQVQTVIYFKKDGFIREGKTYKYTIVGAQIKLDGGPIYRVDAHDTITLEAGSGVDFKYQGK